MNNIKLIKKYILEADDIEVLSDNKLLIFNKELRILLNNISSEFLSECYEVFGKKFRQKIRSKKYIKVIWLEEEINYLKKNYRKQKLEDLSKKINKSEYQINLMLSKLGLLKKGEWEKDDLAFLKKNLKESSIWLAGRLERSIFSIKAKKRVIKTNLE